MEQYLFIGPKTLHDFPLLNLNFCTLPDHSANTEAADHIFSTGPTGEHDVYWILNAVSFTATRLVQDSGGKYDSPCKDWKGQFQLAGHFPSSNLGKLLPGRHSSQPARPPWV
jgi:hypothetical protein